MRREYPSNDKVIALFFVLLALVFLPVCDTLPDQQSDRGANLSDAMRASATGNRQDIGGHGNGSLDLNLADSSGAEHSSSSAAGGEGIVSYNNTDYFWQMFASGGVALPVGSNFKSIEHYTLTPFAHEDERDCWAVYLGGATVQLQPGCLADQATDNVWMFETGLAYRRYLNNSRTTISPYLAASGGFVLLGWSYRSPVTSGNETFDNDSLYGGDVSVGFGLATRRDSRFGAFIEADVGGTGFNDTTVNGFHNDVFQPFTYFAFKAGLSFKF